MRIYGQLVLLMTVLISSQVAGEQPTPTTTAVPVLPETLGVGAAANQLEWMKSYDAARKAGTESKLPVMLFVTMKGCHYCDKMQAESFDNPYVADELAREFVPTRLYLDLSLIHI